MITQSAHSIAQRIICVQLQAKDTQEKELSLVSHLYAISALVLGIQQATYRICKMR